MSANDGGKYDGGFHLIEMVEAQRGLSDREIEIFLATGKKPDLSQPPPEELEALDDETQVMSEEDAAAWLSGAPLTASSFFDFDSSHGVSPLYEVVRPKVQAFDFDEHQPRDNHGRWTDGSVGILEKVVKKTVASTKKATPAVIYKKQDDGAVVGHSSSGQRMRWDAGRKKFIVEKEKDGKWTEESAHTKTSAYNEMKNPDKWFEPAETSTENGPSEPSQKPEPDLADTDTTAETPELPAETVKSGDVEVDTSPTVETPDTGDDVKIAGPDILLHDGESVFTNTKGASSFYTYPGTKPYTPEWSARNDYVDEEVSVPLNRKLRNGKPLSPNQQKVADVMDDTIAKYQTEYEADVFRAVRISDDLLDSWTTPGSTITDPAFMSTATSRAMAERSLQTNSGNAAMMKIRLPKGTNAAPGLVDTHNNDDGAGELVLGRNTTLQIVDAKKNNGIWEISANVVPKTSNADENVDAVPPEIPQQADAPAIETDTPGTYIGPTIEDYAGAPKDVTDKVRAAYLAQVLHEQRIEDRGDQLRKENPDKYTGYNAWMDAQKDARAELAGEAPPDSDLDDALDELKKSLPDYTVRDNIRRRLHLEASVERRFTEFSEKNDLGALTPEVKADLTKRTKEAFAGKKVAVRVSPKTVEHILNDGRIKSQFETNKSSGKKNVDMRASVERLLFGINDKPWQNAEKRPIYGYVAMDGIRPVGIGSAELGSPSTDALCQYGQVQVVLKDSVRDRTTALFGDSLNNMQEAIPTPINNPDWRSFQASRGGITGKGLDGLDRSGENQEFRAGAYAEAQIHGGVSVDDIEEIVFPSNPTATVKQQLEKAGIPYRVLNFKTAADGSDEERANALRIAKQDKPFLEGEIKKLQDKLADPKYKGDTYYTNDLAKYEKQLKAINDALPLLEGTKTSPAKKVAAAKAKVAKATAPKQAEAPKIESTGGKLSAAEENELTSLRSQIDDLYGQSGYWRMREAEITHKSNGGVLTPQDIKDSEQARAELKKLRDAATPLAERELELRMKRDGDVFGDAEDVNAERWASKAKPSAVMLPGNDPAKIEKIADSYRVNDKQTTEHNMSLRSDEPTQAAVAWRSRMKRMINSQQLTQDSIVYRGAALTPDRITQLRPGSVMIDPGSMSTADTRGDAAFYMRTRLDDLPGTIGTMFEIRAPKGMSAADVEYGEFVFDFHTPMRIVSTKRDEHGIVNVVAELVPPAEAKALYGAPPTPKAAKPSGVNLNTGKKGSINAKEAKRYQEDFAKAGLQPSSSPQEIFDKLKSKAYYNDRSIMQILEAIDAIKPGYKKTVLDWVKTPAGSAHVSKTPTS